MLRLLELRGKERILIALRNGENVMLGHVQSSGQSLRVHCQVMWNLYFYLQEFYDQFSLRIFSKLFWRGSMSRLINVCFILVESFVYTFHMSIYKHTAIRDQCT